MTSETGLDRSAAQGVDAVAGLVALLDLEQIEQDIFRGLSPGTSLQRVFGGQVAGQALAAAGKTVDPTRPVHSLHAYFIRPGDPSVPLLYIVDRVRDGGSFSVRRVVTVQHGRPIFTLSASFQMVQAGFDHSAVMPSGGPGPEELPTLQQRVAAYPQVAEKTRLIHPFDIRYATTPSWESRESGPTEEPLRLWMRTDAPLPDDPALHACVLTFATDLTLMDTVMRRQGVDYFTDSVTSASLDHAMWFHRPFRADEWFMYESESVSASGSRGLASGKLFTADGTHIVTVMQEGLIRT